MCRKSGFTYTETDIALIAAFQLLDLGYRVEDVVGGTSLDPHAVLEAWEATKEHKYNADTETMEPKPGTTTERRALWLI